MKRGPQVGGFVPALVVFKRGAGRLLLFFGLDERLMNLLGCMFRLDERSTGSLKFGPDSLFRLSRLVQFSVQTFGFIDQLAFLPFVFFCSFELVFQFSDGLLAAYILPLQVVQTVLDRGVVLA